eukprot:m.147864 g.147864  ORF g.147864 m.147864 type:complete len:277 (+) comp15049_c1_seq3:410-1240(+)
MCQDYDERLREIEKRIAATNIPIKRFRKLPINEQLSLIEPANLSPALSGPIPNSLDELHQRYVLASAPASARGDVVVQEEDPRIQQLMTFIICTLMLPPQSPSREEAHAALIANYQESEVQTALNTLSMHHMVSRPRRARTALPGDLPNYDLSQRFVKRLLSFWRADTLAHARTCWLALKSAPFTAVSPTGGQTALLVDSLASGEVTCVMELANDSTGPADTQGARTLFYCFSVTYTVSFIVYHSPKHKHTIILSHSPTQTQNSYLLLIHHRAANR